MNSATTHYWVSLSPFQTNKTLRVTLFKRKEHCAKLSSKQKEHCATLSSKQKEHCVPFFQTKRTLCVTLFQAKTMRVNLFQTKRTMRATFFQTKNTACHSLPNKKNTAYSILPQDRKLSWQPNKSKVVLKHRTLPTRAAAFYSSFFLCGETYLLSSLLYNEMSSPS